MLDQLLVGTANRGKAAEIARFFEGLPFRVVNLTDFPRVPEPDEDGDSFEANAIKKATYYAQRFGMPCLADDSGLVVDALDGAPGIYSARYAGPGATDAANNQKLLAQLVDTQEIARTARFVCCVAVANTDNTPHTETGVVEGRIILESRGASGFGYDPLFVPDGLSKTFGELDAVEKLSISHRGRALRKLRAYLEKHG